MNNEIKVPIESIERALNEQERMLSSQELLKKLEESWRKAGALAQTFVSEVKVLGITFEVKLVKEDVIRKALKKKNKSKNDTSIYFGCVDFGKEIIFINKNVSEQRKLRTLWHEINHIIVYDYNAGYEGGTFDEERVVDCFSKGFVQIIEDNPQLLEMFGRNKSNN